MVAEERWLARDLGGEILGGAAVHRCGNCLDLNLAAEDAAVSYARLFFTAVAVFTFTFTVSHGRFGRSTTGSSRSLIRS
jgi:hypothetical protein